MTPEIVLRTSIDGLHFQKNLLFTNNDGSRSKIISSIGPGVNDFVTHSSAFEYFHYGIHVGQVDRLTFLGPRHQKITGYFIDCRKSSPTLHKKVKIEFFPDPQLCLYIDRGIAHTFDGLQGILTRDEPLWYMSHNNPDYQLGNDVVSFDREIDDKSIPVVEINDLPIPLAVYKIILAYQQTTLEKPEGYFLRFPTNIRGQKKYALIRDKRFAEQFQIKDVIHA